LVLSFSRATVTALFPRNALEAFCSTRRHCGVVVVDDHRVELLLGKTTDGIQIAAALHTQPKLAENGTEEC